MKSKINWQVPSAIKNPLSVNLFAGIFTFIFFLIACFGVFHHEMWSDETHAWLIARDSHSLRELFFNKRYEGHPVLWYVILFVLTSITKNVLIMQFLHAVIASSFVFVWLRFAPFPKTIKILSLISYYFIYEYTVLSRLYSTELLLLFLICIAYKNKFHHPLFFVLLMVLAANTNLFGFIIVTGITVLTILDFQKVFYGNKNITKWKLILASILLTVGLGFSIISMIPPADCYFGKGWNTDLHYEHFIKIIGKIWEGFIPVPELKITFWDTNFITNDLMKAVLSFFIIVAASKALKKDRPAMWLYLLVSVIMLAFFYLKHTGFTRHHGQMFIAFLVFLWIIKEKGREEKIPSKVKTDKYFFLKSVLIMQGVAGIFAFITDWLYPFSPSRETADYISKLKYKYILSVKNHYTEAPVGAYLNIKPYCPERGCYCSFFLLTTNNIRTLDAQQTLNESYYIALETKMKVILVMENDLETSVTQFQVKKIFESKKQNINDPPFYVYEVDAMEKRK